MVDHRTATGSPPERPGWRFQCSGGSTENTGYLRYSIFALDKTGPAGEHPVSSRSFKKSVHWTKTTRNSTRMGGSPLVFCSLTSARVWISYCQVQFFVIGRNSIFDVTIVISSSRNTAILRQFVSNNVLFIVTGYFPPKLMFCPGKVRWFNIIMLL